MEVIEDRVKSDQVTIRSVDPHPARTKAILKKHPQIKTLFGHTPSTSLFVFLSVAVQIGLCYFLQSSPVWVIFLTAYFVGAFINHGIWALVHDLTHDLVFKNAFINKLLLLVANFPLFFPSTMAFRKYHIFHHRFQGQPEMDADLPCALEKNFVRRSGLRKGLWLLFYFFFQTIRVTFVKKIPLWDRWFVVNWISQVAFLVAAGYFVGFYALLYLFLASAFAIGLHPVGARWIQEHYLVIPNQETYSYYGPLNYLSFNVGYHNEHHDFMAVPWSRLPQVRSMAPEYYNSLHFHNSWTALLLRFLRDPNLNLESRTTR